MYKKAALQGILQGIYQNWSPKLEHERQQVHLLWNRCCALARSWFLLLCP